MKPSSIAIRAWIKTVRFRITSTAVTIAVRIRPVSSQAMANIPITVALPASVESARQPMALSP